MFEEPPARTEMDLAVRREGVIFNDLVTAARQPVVSPLKWKPMICALDSVTNALRLRRGMVGIHDSDNGRESRRPKFSKAFVNIGRNPVEVIIGVNFSEV